MLIVAALCGVRFGELAAFRWSDLRDGLLYVEHAVWNRLVDDDKTEDPRIVLVPQMAQEHLQAHRQRKIAEQHPALCTGLIFPASPQQALAGARRRGSSDLNWYRYPSCLKVPIARIVERAELPTITAHSLRRSWDKWTKWAGVDHMARRAMAGWRTEEAHAIYDDFDPDQARPAMESALKKMMSEEM